MDHIADFNDIMGEILNALGIDDNLRDEIIRNAFNVFNVENRFELIANVRAHVVTLINADRRLNNTINEIPQIYRDAVINNWNVMKRQLGELQGLILLKKVQNNDCPGAINAILGAVTAKTEAVNNILRRELGEDPGNRGNLLGGGGDDDLRYRSKYLKYKAKYLNLLQK